MGWLNIYILVIYRRYVPETVSIYFITIPLIFIILAIDGKFYENMQYHFVVFFVIISWTFSF
jgi:hypothetical protein